MSNDYWAAFVELIRTPFEFAQLIWGIVPLYFALLLSEMTSVKASFRTAIQTGFSLLWAGAQWLYPYFRTQPLGGPRLELDAMLPINLLVTFLVLGLGAVALLSGIRRKYPKYGSFLGHRSFSAACKRSRNGCCVGFNFFRASAMENSPTRSISGNG